MPREDFLYSFKITLHGGLKVTLYAPVTSAALVQRLIWLNRLDLHAKVIELRSRVDTYLRGVHTTFEFFTSHAVDHSDQIIRELSNLLYVDADDQTSATLNLNATETYMLLQAAYLHDAGMVVTDQEKFAVLSSSEWRSFAAENKQVADDIRKRQSELDKAVTQPQELFIKSLELRLLLADFFRRRHAARSQGAISGALRVGVDFLGGDQSAEHTLGIICSGHGLNRGELASETNFPTRRDIFGDPVNVRLLAILLRLGDLLDMRSDRACPLLQSIASPLPQSSKVHWSQYRRVTNRVTSPSRIEVRAECETADEHRTIRDWCKWICDEVREAPRLLVGSMRHAGWTPPKASIGDANDTIQILRSPGARYRVEDWRFHFDEGEVVTRLIRDVHRQEFGFVRELLQNALDATRARAYQLTASKQLFPNQLPANIREQLPITVTMHAQGEVVRSVSISDSGLGMSTDTIKNYFLQIGRSWYRSPEFAEKFQYSHTSRFGIGFLSVFAVSDDVTVTTRWHEDRPESSLRMRLHGPNSFLLLEDVVREQPGTTVTVNLTRDANARELVAFLRECCLANEFLVHLDLVDEGREARLASLPEFEPEVVEWAISDSVRCLLRRVPANVDGVFGCVKFLVLEVNGVEDWTIAARMLDKVLSELNPLCTLPSLGDSWVSVNGLAPSRQGAGPFASRLVGFELDFRTPDAAGGVGLDRTSIPTRAIRDLPGLEFALAENAAEHESDCMYLSKLAERFQWFAPHWAANLKCIDTVLGPTLSYIELACTPEFSIACPDNPYLRLPAGRLAILASLEYVRLGEAGVNGVVLDSRVVDRWNFDSLREFGQKLHVTSVNEIASDLFLVGFELGDDVFKAERHVRYCDRFPLGSDILLFRAPLDLIIINAAHPLIVALDAIPEEHSNGRQRIISHLADRFPVDDSLEKLIRGTGKTLESDVLLKFADRLAETESPLISSSRMTRAWRL